MTLLALRTCVPGNTSIKLRDSPLQRSDTAELGFMKYNFFNVKQWSTLLKNYSIKFMYTYTSQSNQYKQTKKRVDSSRVNSNEITLLCCKCNAVYACSMHTIACKALQGYKKWKLKQFDIFRRSFALYASWA